MIFFQWNFFTKNWKAWSEGESKIENCEKKKERKKERERERERERGKRERCHKFLKNLCGTVQRIPANFYSYLHPPPYKTWKNLVAASQPIFSATKCTHIFRNFQLPYYEPIKSPSSPYFFSGGAEAVCHTHLQHWKYGQETLVYEMW